MNQKIGGLEPILCAHLLREVDAKLIELVGALEPEQWDLPTVAPGWNVRDVAAHLLDTALRKLSAGRDQWRVEKVAVRSHDDVIVLVNRLNREGVTVYRRLSSRVLLELLHLACEQAADYHLSLDPFSQAAIGVSWAGEMTSLNWFDTARELTERWHHQQQIRLATNRPGIMTPELYYPVLDCFLRGLPHAFRDVAVGDGAKVLIEITGQCGGRWILTQGNNGWRFQPQSDQGWSARVTIPQEIAWRIFTKGIDQDAARAQTTIEGDRKLGERVLRLTAVVG